MSGDKVSFIRTEPNHDRRVRDLEIEKTLMKSARRRYERLVSVISWIAVATLTILLILLIRGGHGGD